jgi:hypothetical protein
MKLSRKQSWWLWLGMAVTLAALAIVTAAAPVERTLGERARLVYLHGAWVWTGKAVFGAAAVAGAAGLALANHFWHKLSLALGRVGLFFWLTYLPMSLWVQMMNWGGIFWDEPRWRIPLMFGVVGVLLQAGLAIIGDLRLASALNLVFGALLWWLLGNIQNVLHPDSPIFQSDAARIQLFFIGMVVLSVVFGALLTRLIYQPEITSGAED